MNKRQKILQEQFLNNEEAVIRKLKNQYHHSLKDIEKKAQSLQDDINRLGTLANLAIDDEEKAQFLSMQQSKVYQKQYQDALKKQIGSILDNMQVEEFKTVSEYLQKCYEEGFVGTMYDLQGQGIPLCFPLDQEAMVRAVQLDSKISNGLYSRLGEDVSLLKKKITAQVTRGIATGMSFQQVAQQLSKISDIGFNNAVRIARTEGHRIQVQSAMDACYKAKEKGADVVKQWDATLDSSTRESHQQVDGEIRELDKKFSNGLMFPGDPSGGAAEVVNCRCALLQRARWALTDEEFTKMNGKTGELVKIKAKDYDEFKKQYWQEAKKQVLTNNTNNDIMLAKKYGFNTISGEHTREADLAATNPNYNKGREYRVNCQRCVSAYEARRRGFDVEALPAPGGADRMPYMFDKKEGWTSVYDGIQPIHCTAARTAGVKTKVEETMASFGDGARAIVRVQWQQKYGGGGHVFIAEQTEGKTIFIDPQPNKTDVSNYFSMAKTKETYVLRIDNLEFTAHIKKCCKNVE